MNQPPADPSREEVPAEVLDHAIHRLNDAVPRQEVIAELVEMGIAEATAADVVRRAQDLHGSPEAPGRARGSPAFAFFKVVGYLTVLVGLVLWLGNSSGWFLTFPFAGLLTVLLGVGVLSIVQIRERTAANDEE